MYRFICKAFLQAECCRYNLVNSIVNSIHKMCCMLLLCFAFVTECNFLCRKCVMKFCVCEEIAGLHLCVLDNALHTLVLMIWWM